MCIFSQQNCWNHTLSMTKIFSYLQTLIFKDERGNKDIFCLSLGEWGPWEKDITPILLYKSESSKMTLSFWGCWVYSDMLILILIQIAMPRANVLRSCVNLTPGYLSQFWFFLAEKPQWISASWQLLVFSGGYQKWLLQFHHRCPKWTH